MISLFLLAGIIADWNGTWAGNWKHGDGVQIIMAGKVAAGFFLHGNYLPDELHASVSPDGKTLTIRWSGSSAVLQRDTATTAHIMIRELGHADAAFGLSRDP
jgi:hypothetical protein